jgi:hypothetical protein
MEPTERSVRVSEEVSMFCPRCGSEYREGFVTCVDCEVPLVVEPPSEETDSLEDLVPAIETDDHELFAAAGARLQAMGIPYDAGPAPEAPGKPSDADRARLRGEIHFASRGQILVAPSYLERAELCLTDLEESVEAARRELARHGLAAEEQEEEDEKGRRGLRQGSSRPLRYCPRCGSMHRGFSSCVDCGVALVREAPAFAPAEPTRVLATLDPELLAEGRRLLRRAGVPFEWGRLGRGPGSGPSSPDEPAPDPLVPAGQILVPAAREREARELLGSVAAGAPAQSVSRSAAADRAGRPGQDGDAGDSEVQDGEDGDPDDILYCPRCGGEYRAGFRQCADCMVPLVAHRPPPGRLRSVGAYPLQADAEGPHCSDCGSPLPSVEAICPRCSPADEDGGEDERAEERQAGTGDGEVWGTAGPDGETRGKSQGGRSRNSVPYVDDWWPVRAGLPNARADYFRITALYGQALVLALSGVLFPWVVELVAFRKANEALILTSTYGQGDRLLERQLRRVRWFALACLSAAWGAVGVYLARRLGGR